MANAPIRPLSGLILGVLLIGCEGPGLSGSSAEMSFAAPKVVSAETLQFASAADPVTTFGAGSAALDDVARQNLAAQAQWLAARPLLSVHLIGGAEAGEEALAARRVEAVRDMLVAGGVDATRIRLGVASELQIEEAEMRLATAVLTEIAAPRIAASAPLIATPAPGALEVIELAVPTVPVQPTATTPVAAPVTPGIPVVTAPPVVSAPPAVDEVPPLPVVPGKKPKRPNSGKGNGGEGGDPGNSGANNNAGDD